MGRMLNWCDALLATARQRMELHRYGDAFRLLQRIANSPMDNGCDEAQLLFVQCCLKLGRFKDARRVLRPLVLRCPQHAPYHHLLAQAIESDPRIDAGRAFRHYRRAIRLDPGIVEYLKDAGEFAASIGQEETGLSWLRKAHELAPNDLEILQTLVETLCDFNQFEAARQILANARFRHGRSATYQMIHFECEFRALHARQEQPSEIAEDCTVFPFLRVMGTGKRSHRTWRADEDSRPRPHWPRPSRRFKTRHAP